MPSSWPGPGAVGNGPSTGSGERLTKLLHILAGPGAGSTPSSFCRVVCPVNTTSVDPNDSFWNGNQKFPDSFYTEKQTKQKPSADPGSPRVSPGRRVFPIILFITFGNDHTSLSGLEIRVEFEDNVKLLVLHMTSTPRGYVSDANSKTRGFPPLTLPKINSVTCNRLIGIDSKRGRRTGNFLLYFFTLWRSPLYRMRQMLQFGCAPISGFWFCGCRRCQIQSEGHRMTSWSYEFVGDRKCQRKDTM